MTTIGPRPAPVAPRAPATTPAPTTPATPGTTRRAYDQTFGPLQHHRDTFGASARELAGRPNSLAGAITSNLPTHRLAGDSFEAGRAVARVGQRGDAVQASVLEARVGAQYRVTVGANGLRANASGNVEATLAQASARTGIGTDAAGVRVGAQAYAGARVEGAAGLTLDPSIGAYQATVRQEVFMGARAGVSGRAALGPLGAAEGRVDVQAGLGASIEATAGFQNGRLRFGGEVGVAVGVGARVRGSVEINVQPVIDAGRAVADGARAVGGAVADGARTVSGAVADGAAAVGDGAVRLFQLGRSLIWG